MSTKNISEIVEKVEKLSLLEVADLVKTLEEKFGVSAAMPVAAAAVAPTESKPAEEEKTEFTVTLKDSGAEKIKVIKALRAVTSLGLKEAKDMTEAVPAVVAQAVNKDEAKKMKEALEGAGAKVELS
ncbi:50S ribosomal protein L7/L12 [Candidatus Babeliales bacterium]|nr:50S ribosomal protein L7/L12 [Candidatus Babeliales bacterium]MCF7899340.1 50S ribosomal protein L7/L12 [Candidatus Babeliales bacterium]